MLAELVKELKPRRDIAKKERIYFIILMFLPCILLSRSLDNDIWFLLNSGRYVFEHGIPYIEPFTIHQGFEFVMQQWLTASIFWTVYSNFGTFGINVLVMICYALIICTLYKLCMKVSEDYFFISFSITMFTSSIISLFMVQRPYVFSMLLLLIEIYLLESFLLTKKKKFLYCLPILSLLLINLHAAMWPMLFIIMVPYIIDSFPFKIAFLTGQGYEKKTLLLMISIMLLMGFLNPYGIDAMTYLFKSYGHEEISKYVFEMKAPNINSFMGLIIYIIFFIVLSIYLINKKGTTKLRYILLTLGTAYMTLSSIRNLSLFEICGLFPLAYYLKDFELPYKNSERPKKHLMLRKILIALLVMIVLFGLYSANKFAGESEYDLLNDTIKYLQEEDNIAQVKLYTGYDEGGLAEYLNIPSYIDPRAEVFVKENNKKEDIMLEYIGLQKGSIYYKDFLDKYQFTHLLLAENDILYTYLAHDLDYQVTYSNDEYSLYEKKR